MHYSPNRSGGFVLGSAGDDGWRPSRVGLIAISTSRLILDDAATRWRVMVIIST